MARPRKNTKEPSAKERIYQAFWAELEEVEYRKITVGSVVARAGVNRNSFYYHFDCLPDLAHVCIQEQLPKELFQVLLTDGPYDAIVYGAARRSVHMEERLGHLRLAAGVQGSGELAMYVRDEIARFWLQGFGLEWEQLDQPERFTIRFLTGGIVAMLGELSRENALPQLLEYLESPFFQAASSAGVKMLKDVRARVNGPSGLHA